MLWDNQTDQLDKEGLLLEEVTTRIINKVTYNFLLRLKDWRTHNLKVQELFRTIACSQKKTNILLIFSSDLFFVLFLTRDDLFLLSTIFYALVSKINPYLKKDEKVSHIYRCSSEYENFNF